MDDDDLERLRIAALLSLKKPYQTNRTHGDYPFSERTSSYEANRSKVSFGNSGSIHKHDDDYPPFPMGSTNVQLSPRSAAFVAENNSILKRRKERSPGDKRRWSPDQHKTRHNHYSPLREAKPSHKRSNLGQREYLSVDKGSSRIKIAKGNSPDRKSKHRSPQPSKKSRLQPQSQRRDRTREDQHLARTSKDDHRIQYRGRERLDSNRILGTKTVDDKKYNQNPKTRSKSPIEPNIQKLVHSSEKLNNECIKPSLTEKQSTPEEVANTNIEEEEKGSSNSSSGNSSSSNENSDVDIDLFASDDSESENEGRFKLANKKISDTGYNVNEKVAVPFASITTSIPNRRENNGRLKERSSSQRVDNKYERRSSEKRLEKRRRFDHYRKEDRLDRGRERCDDIQQDRCKNRPDTGDTKSSVKAADKKNINDRVSLDSRPNKRTKSPSVGLDNDKIEPLKRSSIRSRLGKYERITIDATQKDEMAVGHKTNRASSPLMRKHTETKYKEKFDRKTSSEYKPEKMKL